MVVMNTFSQEINMFVHMQCASSEQADKALGGFQLNGGVSSGQIVSLLMM